jgi:glycosyltransferase involved in cell wall biosynthesis
MKILVVQDHLRSGGTERQSILLARAFTAAGHPTTLLTFRPNGALAGDLSGVSHLSLLHSDLHLDWFAPGLLRAVRAAAPDVVLCMGRMANCYAGFIQRSSPRVTVIGTMRTGKPLSWLFRRSLRRVSHIVANSHAAKQTLIDTLQLSAGKITVIHNSLVFGDGTGGGRDETLRIGLGASPKTTVLLCVAMFRPGKNQHELIDLADGLPKDLDWQLWLAGDGITRVACEHTVAKRHLGSRVKFLGWQRDPSSLYVAADIAVHASQTESLSNFVIEAQAHGLPAVVYEVQGISECFLPGETGFVLPRGDCDGFRRAVERLARATPTERADRAARARAYAVATFDPQRHTQEYLELLGRLTGGRKDKAGR